MNGSIFINLAYLNRKINNRKLRPLTNQSRGNNSICETEVFTWGGRGREGGREEEIKIDR
jgi:hypothetical protein